MDPDISDEIDRLMLAGKYVVIGEIDYICPVSGEALCRETVIISVQDNRYKANQSRWNFDWPEVYGQTVKVLPLKK